MFYKLKTLDDLKNFCVIVYQCSANDNSELGIKNFYSKHDSMCKRKIPSYCFYIHCKKAITGN